MQAQLKQYIVDSLPRRIRILPEKGGMSCIVPPEQVYFAERAKLHHNDRHFLMTDYDQYLPDASNHYDIRPNFIIYNVQKCTHQAFWLLGTPVHIQNKQSAAAQYLRAIEGGFDAKYRCDNAFKRDIHRNPLFYGSDIEWMHTNTHELRQLASVVELNVPKRIESAVGRNDELFNNVRLSGYRIVKNHPACDFEWLLSQLFQIAKRLNDFKEKLPESELRSICRSIARFCLTRLNQPMTDAQFSAKQARRGAFGGRKSKRKAVETSARTTKPWDDQGISRATYYRQKKISQNCTKSE